MRTPRPHGQSLVVFCLTLLLITLMVCLTLSFSMKLHEKMEAQNVADLAAYSGAVATARTFNEIALMRRAQTGELVAITSVMSLISWTSMVRADLNAARMSAMGCPAAAAALDKLDEKNTQILQKWNELDAKAGVQAYNIQLLGNYLAYMQGKLFERLQDTVSGGDKSMVAQLAKLESQGSRFPDELHARPTPVSVAEVISATGGSGYSMDNAMASRGYEFITRRQGPVDMSTSTTGGILGALEGAGGKLRVLQGGGSAYWGKTLGHGGRADSGWFTWAEDHATVEVTFPGCATFTVQATAGVKSTDENDHTDNHWWTPASPVLGDQDPGMEKEYRHTLMPCPDPRYCPNTFVGGINYNTDDHSADNLFAEPKIYALAQRDYRKRGLRNDPWELMFRFQFTPNSSSPFDSHGWTLGDGTDISVQQALGTGLAYYHRPGHWNEAPNLWNPFWRATLVSADVDSGGDPKRGGNDVPATVGEPAGEAFRQLIQAGYKGAH